MRCIPLIFIFFLSGCASVQAPGYISRVDHPYERKFYGSFEKVTSAFIYVLKKKGWTISAEADPSVYERDDRYDNNGYQNLLIITQIRKSNRVLYTSFSRLNVFIHAIENTCNVEIRYETQKTLIKQFISTQDDELVRGILDAAEQEVNK